MPTKGVVVGVQAGNGRWWTPDRAAKLEQLRCVEGLNYDEIAVLLGSTEKAVKQYTMILGLRFTPQAWAIRRAKRDKARSKS